MATSPGVTVASGDALAQLAGGALPDVAAVLARRQDEALAAAARWSFQGSELLLVGADRADERLRAELREDGFTLVEDDTATPPTRRREPEPGRAWVLTSGSTGRPSRVGHTLSSLTTVSSRQPPRRWLLAYTPGAYAWWQVVSLLLSQPDQEVVALDGPAVADWPRLAAAHQVTAASGTPTFWRQGLWRDPQALAQIPLEQLTLGGEPVDQSVLDRLRAVFPDARITWIYASSEVGAVVAVHDGRAGFPAEWLDAERSGRPSLSIDGDELLVRSPFSAVGADGLFRTGDRVVVEDARVRIVGRIGSDEINVGGAKISAARVRDVLLSHPGVSWVAVRGRRAPLVGSVVVADVVADDVDEQELTAWCAARLPEHGVPRRLRLLEQIPLRESLKSDV